MKCSPKQIISKNNYWLHYTIKHKKAVFRIRLILIWIRILGSDSWNDGSCSKSDLVEKISTFVLLFFYKKIFLRNMICFVIYGVNIHVSKHKFSSFEKIVWYSKNLRLIFWEIFQFLLLPGSGSGWPKWSGSKWIRNTARQHTIPLGRGPPGRTVSTRRRSGPTRFGTRQSAHLQDRRQNINAK